VSSGYPIVGATVTLKGSNGATLQVVDSAKTGSVTIPRSEALGVLGFGPYLAQSTGGTANGVPVTESYFSIASSDAGRTNITPITHLIAVEATGSATTDGIKKLFTSGFDSTKAQQLTSTRLAAAKTSVGATLNLMGMRSSPPRSWGRTSFCVSAEPAHLPHLHQLCARRLARSAPAGDWQLGNIRRTKRLRQDEKFQCRLLDPRQRTDRHSPRHAGRKYVQSR